jgi:pimeloyl-ACP methyl ester carboxylesterase
LGADAVAAVNALRNRPDLDKDHIGLIGSSQGGLVAGIAATKIPELKYVLLLAPPAVRGDQLCIRQRKDADIFTNRSQSEINRGVEFNQYLVNLAKTDMAPSAIITEMIKFDMRPGREPYCISPRFMRAHVDPVTQSVFRSTLHLDPATVFKKLRPPVLAIYGDKDIRVAADENVPAIKRALVDGANPDATVKLWPDLSHDLTNVTEPLCTDTIAPKVLDYLTDWVLKHIKG